MSSLRSIPILFRFALDREHMGSPARIANWGEHLQHRVFVQAPLLHHGFFFFIPYFFEIHLRRFPIIYFCNCFFCSNDWNKISKFEREFWSNGKSRLHQGFFFVLLISSPSKQKGRLLLLIWSPFPFLKVWMGKKQHEIRREGRTNEKTMFTPRIFPFLCSLFFCEH